MDQTVDGAVGRRLQRVVGTVQPVLQRLQTEEEEEEDRAGVCCHKKFDKTNKDFLWGLRLILLFKVQLTI